MFSDFSARLTRRGCGQSEKPITARFVVDLIDEWLDEELTKPRVLVLDNARIQRILFAGIFTAFEFNRNVVAADEIS